MTVRQSTGCPTWVFMLGATLPAVLLLLAVLAVRAVTTMQADRPTQASQRELAIERSLACPQCTALPLDICDRDICKDMRSVVRDKIAAGESDRGIREYFVERYGARVLLAPAADRANLLVWLVPGVGLLVGALGLYAFVHLARRTAPSRTGQRPVDPGMPAYRNRVEGDLERYE